MTGAAWLLSAALSASAAAFDPAHPLWDRVLKERVRDARVDYAALKAGPQALDAYLDALARVPAAEYEVWSREDKEAFWINAYNALTVKAVLDHYPIQPSWAASLRYPKNSIRQIPGVWDKLTFRVLGRSVTLEGIEHGILRKDFAEPRVHMALVCASVGCPALRGEAFVGARLGAQLDDQSRTFLKDPAKFRLDAAARTVHLSPIFKWYAEDFARAYPPAEGAALRFAARYLDAADRRALESGGFAVRYLDYDWSLNDRGGP